MCVILWPNCTCIPSFVFEHFVVSEKLLREKYCYHPATQQLTHPSKHLSAHLMARVDFCWAMLYILILLLHVLSIHKKLVSCYIFSTYLVRISTQFDWHFISLLSLRIHECQSWPGPKPAHLCQQCPCFRCGSATWCLVVGTGGPHGTTEVYVCRLAMPMSRSQTALSVRYRPDSRNFVSRLNLLSDQASRMACMADDATSMRLYASS